MKLIGHRVVTLDRKNRLTLPTNFRVVLPRQLLICAGFLEGCMFVFTEDSFGSYEVWAENTLYGERREMWSRATYASLAEVKLDRQGRFVLPKDGAIRLSFGKEIYLYGLGDRLALYPKPLT